MDNIQILQRINFMLSVIDAVDEQGDEVIEWLAREHDFALTIIYNELEGLKDEIDPDGELLEVAKPTSPRWTPSKIVLTEILAERRRQDAKWGEQNHNPPEWLMILGEEVGEANKASLEACFAGYPRTGDFSDYRKELIQVAAVAVAAIESMDRQLIKGRTHGSGSI